MVLAERLRPARSRPIPTVRVRVKGGYQPSVVRAHAGEPLRIVFSREEMATCSEHVVFPAFGMSAMLPPFEDVTIDLVPEKAGEYEFTCQLGALRGRLVVEDRPTNECSSERHPRASPAPDARPRRSVTGAFERPSFLGRVWAAVLAVWGGFIGLLPHVLHHVGPLAGAALLAGATGRVLFAAIGFVAAIPFLRRLHRRFRTWKAPAIALAVFAAAFSLSSFVVGPAIAGDDSPAGPGIEDGGHAEHH